MSILNLSQYATVDVGTECDTGKTKITCYYALKYDLTRLNGLTTVILPPRLFMLGYWIIVPGIHFISKGLYSRIIKVHDIYLK